jgi:GT2 family glycosyltransferase
VVSGLPAPTTVILEHAILSGCSVLNRGIPAQPKILAVVVLYKCSINQSSTCISMRAQDAYDRDAISILIYDNSPIGDADDLPPNWVYVSDPTNKGLSAAYNHAISQAKLSGAHWLLLLDQDSNLPRNFLADLQGDVVLCQEKSEIVAIVPIVFSNQRQVSPIRPMLGLDRPYEGTQTATSVWLTAINSAAAIRVSFVESIGGFSNDFWLDYLDHWLFRRIYDTAHLVYVSNMKIDHNLSVANFNQGLEVSRYKNVLTAEAAFTNECLPIYWRLILTLRLIARAIKHAIFTRNKSMALLMFWAAWKQVFSIFGLRSKKPYSRIYSENSV